MGPETAVTPQLWAALGIMLTLLLAVCIAAIMFSIRNNKKLVDQFSKIGEKFDLELTVPKATMGGLYRRNPTLYGRYKGHEVSVFPKGYGLDNTRQTDTAVRVTTRATKSLHFSLTRRNISGKMGQLGRLKDTPTGDPAFDEAFSFKSKDPDSALPVLNESWRARILKEWPEADCFLTLENGILTFLRFGLPYEDAARVEIETIVESCVDLSEAI